MRNVLARTSAPLPGASRSARRAFAAVGLVACLAAALAQGALGQAAAGETVVLPVPKDQIPLYNVVNMFFVLMGHFERNQGSIYEQRLRDIGIEPGSKAAAAFSRAIASATPILEQPSFDSSLSKEQFVSFQEHALQEKARRLARVYGGLLADLEAAGFDPETFRRYIEESIRPTVSLWVEVPPGRNAVTELLEDRNVQMVLPFEMMTEAEYRRGATNSPVNGGLP